MNVPYPRNILASRANLDAAAHEAAASPLQQARAVPDPRLNQLGGFQSALDTLLGASKMASRDVALRPADHPIYPPRPVYNMQEVSKPDSLASAAQDAAASPIQHEAAAPTRYVEVQDLEGVQSSPDALAAVAQEAAASSLQKEIAPPVSGVHRIGDLQSSPDALASTAQAASKQIALQTVHPIHHPRPTYHMSEGSATTDDVNKLATEASLRIVERENPDMVQTFANLETKMDKLPREIPDEAHRQGEVIKVQKEADGSNPLTLTGFGAGPEVVGVPESKPDVTVINLGTLATTGSSDHHAA